MSASSTRARRSSSKTPSADILAEVADETGGESNGKPAGKANGKADKNGSGDKLGDLLNAGKKKSDVRDRLLSSAPKKKDPPPARKAQADEDLEVLNERVNGGRRAEEHDELDDDHSEHDEGDDVELDDDVLDLAEESGMTASEAREMAADLGGADKLAKVLRRMGRTRSRDDRDDDDERDDRRGRRRREDDEDDRRGDDEPQNNTRAGDAPGAANTKQSPFKKFEVDAEWGEETKQVMGTVTAHYDTQLESAFKVIDGLTERLEKLDGKFGASEQRRQAQETQRVQKQIDELFAGTVKEQKKLADVFGRIPTAKLPPHSPLRKQRQELIDEMTEIQQSRVRRGRDPLEIPELYQRALDLLHPEEVTERIRNNVTSEIRRASGSTLPRANGRRSAADALPQGRDKAMATAERKAKDLFGSN